MVEHEFVEEIDSPILKRRKAYLYREYIELVKQLEIDGKMLKITFDTKAKAVDFRNFISSDTGKRQIGIRNTEAFSTAIVPKDEGKKKDNTKKHHLYIAKVLKGQFD
jgi:O-phosphoseryl-tRNA(Cys) synthetase